MVFQPEYLEVSLQESFMNPYLDLAQHPLLDACVNDIAVTPQDVCNKPILDTVLEPVNDSSVQVQENEMSCEPIEVHNEQWLLSQKPFQNACLIGVEDVPSDVLPQPLPCGEQTATSNLPIELINKPLELLSQLLSSTTKLIRIYQKNQKYYFILCILQWKQNKM